MEPELNNVDIATLVRTHGLFGEDDGGEAQQPALQPGLHVAWAVVQHLAVTDLRSL